MRTGLILAALVAVGGTPAAAQQAVRDGDFRVADIQIRLLYEESGALSRDITAPPAFVGWNTIIGGGDAKENAHDLLVTAMIAGPDQFNVGTPLEITVTDAKRKLLARRRFPGFLAERQTYLSLLVPDAGCAGKMTVTARLGKSVRSESISLDCGE